MEPVLPSKDVLLVTVTDNGLSPPRLSTSAVITIEVVDVNEPPVPGCTVGLRVLESAAIGFSLLDNKVILF